MIEFKLIELGPLAVQVLLQLVIFTTKQKSLKENLRVDYCLLLKYCVRLCTFHPPNTWAKSLTKFSTKMHDLKRVLNLDSKEKEDRTI